MRMTMCHLRIRLLRPAPRGRIAAQRLLEAATRRRLLASASFRHTFVPTSCYGAYGKCFQHLAGGPVTAFHAADVAEAARALDGHDPPDGVYANDELLGVALLRAARHRRLDVPGDLMIAVAADRQPVGTPSD